MKKQIIKCDECGKTFEDYISRRRGQYRFCSKECQYKNMKNRPHKKKTRSTIIKRYKHLCSFCKKIFERKKRSRQQDTFFCSTKCYLRYRKKISKQKTINSIKGGPNTVRMLFNLNESLATNEITIWLRTKNEYVTINPCYLKEARAILEGKDWKGKNKCTKLPGDE